MKTDFTFGRQRGLCVLRVMRAWGLSMLAGIGVLMGAGCSQQAKIDRHLERAGRYAHAAKHREAVIEYMNVLKYQPTNQVAVRGMGLTLYDLGDVRAAVPYLLTAEKQDPGDTDIRLKLGALYLVMGDRPRARERAEAVLRKTPDSLDALVLWGAGVATSNEVKSAISRLSGFGQRFADQPRFHVTLASLYVSIGELDAAEEVYQKALEKSSKSWELHLARGDVYLLKRDMTRADQEYQAAADLAPAGSVARVRLARFRWATGKHAEAQQILDGLLKQDPKMSAAALSRADMALSERDCGTAMKLLEGIMKREPSNLEAFLLMQRVRLAQGELQEVISAYEKLVSAFPKSAQGRCLLAMAWLQKGDVQKAIGECERAVELDADHQDSIRLLSELYIRVGQPDRSLALLKSFVKRHPSAGFAQVLIGEAYRAKGDYAQAANAFRVLTKLVPGSPEGYERLGMALQRLGRDEEAMASFEEALSLEPSLADALEPLAEMLAARSKSWDAAIKRIEAQIVKVPDAAGLYYLLGKAQSQKRDWGKAETAFQKAVALKPDITAAYLGLSYVYMATHKEEEALAKVEGALTVNSNDVASLMMKGALLTSRNDSTNAAVQYERIVAIRPTFVPALNDLACLYQGDPARKDRAYELAQRARSLAPRDPRVADTLGWILFHRAEYQWALTLLQESAERLSSQAEVLYHLGLCQAAMGQGEAARASLSRAVEKSKTFQGSIEAEDMLTVLSASPELSELDSRERVEGFLAAHPANLFALTKGGAFFEKAGDYERARSLYEQAIAQNAHFVPALTCLAALCSEHLNQPERAMGLARQAREEAPGDPRVADMLASIAMKKGDYRWAESLLSETISRAGDMPERQYLLGVSQYALGKTDTATNLIQKAMDAPQGLASAAAAREFMKSVTNPGARAGSLEGGDKKKGLSVEDLPVMMYLAGTHERNNELERARGLYEQVVSRFPDFSPAFRRLALLYGEHLSGSDQEFKTLVRARELLPGDVEVKRVLGEAAYRKGQYEWAARLLQESASDFPNRAEVHYMLGMSLHALKNKEGAKKALKRGLELDPQSSLGGEARDAIAKMK